MKYGLLEKAYQWALIFELQQLGFSVEWEVEVPFIYKNNRIDRAFRVDLLIDKEIVVEVKAVEKMAAVCFHQLYTYLRFLGLRNGVLVNFGEYNFRKDGIFRIDALNWNPRMIENR